MKNKKDASRVMLWFAFVLTCLIILLSVFCAIVLSFNLRGVTDILVETIASSGYALDAESEVTTMIFSFVLSAFVEIYFAIFYGKAIKFKVSSPMFARQLMNKSFWQLILGSFLPALFAMISASLMSKKKRVEPAEVISEASGLNVYKLNVMSEAVERLKQLKASGAISEEEYYASLNRILEG